MLEHLHIRHLALIEDMELDFDEGMNVLTGETGAGKSFILKALGFLLGERLKPDMIRPGCERAHVEALFSHIEGKNEVILRRELLPSGRSRFYVNDELRPQEYARQLREQLIAYTSQHGQQKLLQPAYQNALMEQTIEKPELLQNRDKIRAALAGKRAEREEIEAKRAKYAEMRDLLEMQQQEIDKVDPEEDEDLRLEELRVRARAQENASRDYDDALTLLHGDGNNGLIDIMGEFLRIIDRISNTDESMKPSLDACSSLMEELRSLSSALRHPPVMDDMPEDMDEVESRLFVLSQLKRKLHRTLPQILRLKDEIAEKISFLDVCTLDIRRIQREEEKLGQELKAVIEQLIPLRRKGCEVFAEKLASQLRDLGFSEQVRVIPEYVPYEVWTGIQDEKVRILWAPNPGQPPQPLDRIASGGELSRFLLALASVTPRAEDATFIFDEVDSGVGGLTLNKLADRLEYLAKSSQMLLITHWPQIAVRAGQHFQISKIVRDDQTFTLCSPLDPKARREEIIRMAGGGAQGEAMASALKVNGETS